LPVSWIEGPWVTMHQGKYYLQYAGPGTEYKSYADAVYLALACAAIALKIL